MKRLRYAAMVLAVGGVILMGLGLYFVFVRPPLLPEDPRYIRGGNSGVHAPTGRMTKVAASYRS